MNRTDMAASRRKLQIKGIVQGVGFRPFVYNLAQAEHLAGTVANTSAGVVVEIQGPASALDRFIHRLQHEAPPLARIVSVEAEEMAVQEEAVSFRIEHSTDSPGTSTLIPPDTATCQDCLADLRRPGDRRLGYAFTNCTNCGPRWTIISKIPYDRLQTSMACFPMCKQCQAEYDDPADRRFHAQPNACPRCGPRLWLEDDRGKVVAGRRPSAEVTSAGDIPALTVAAALLAEGRIVAVKGLGGFHLAVRADDSPAVARLRRRKGREAKPLAVMVTDLATARKVAQVTAMEAALLTRPEAPIVLLERLAGEPHGLIAPEIAPGHRRLGIMLPYTPLHHLLLAELAKHGVAALVMTSGNASDEPLCLGNREAKQDLAEIADYWLLHDRDIVRRTDDSVIQVVDHRTVFQRRGRGFSPVPVFLRLHTEGPPVLATGPELKNTICLLKEDLAFVSPHIGDLQNLKAHKFFTDSVATLQAVLECEPEIIAHDLHPDYAGTRWAQEQKTRGKQLVPVQHHHAHLVAVQAEHGLTGPSLGLILDGTGFGADGTIWGGEILAGDAADFTRLGHLETVPLPGGDAAIKAPWRTALSYLRHTFGESDLPDLPFLQDQTSGPVLEMLAKGVNSPLTSSCGRLFDAVAALTGSWQEVHYEAQAASELMALTTSADVANAEPLYDVVEVTGDLLVLPVAPLIRAVVRLVQQDARPDEISARFHRTLIDMWTEAVLTASSHTGWRKVVLAGGVFQNEILLPGMLAALGDRGLEVFSPLDLPANDGAIALGQAVVARARLGGRQTS